jgi:hypothetical protein
LKINPQTFFNFCAAHTSLLRALAETQAELYPAEAMRLIRANPGAGDELPETAWRRLLELQILVPTEPGSDEYFLADPVARVLAYLFNEATPATPEMIRGYVLSLETTGKRLTRALDEDDVAQVQLALEEIGRSLRRIHADLDETHQAILIEVGRYKTERFRVSVRDKFRRIVHWMERYVEPMIDIVRADGPLRAAFDEMERLLLRARAEALVSDHPALARNQRFLRLVGAHALRVFTQCRKELQPLYETLRRSSFIAEGAARALERLQNEGLSKWGIEPIIGLCTLRFQNVPGDAAIELALRRVAQHPPETQPTLVLDSEPPTPGALVHRLWLDDLPAQVRPALPLEDLLEWLTRTHPDKHTAQILSGFSTLLFHAAFQARFTATGQREYPTADGALEASPVQLHAP